MNGTSSESRLMDVNYVRILISPRATIRAIVDRDPRDKVFALIAVAGFIGALAAAIQFRSPQAFSIGRQAIPMIAPATTWKIRIGQVIASPILAILFLYINGAILRWSGSLFGGTANNVEVRAALGWSSVVSILSALILLAFTVIDPPPTPIAASDLHSAWAALAREWPRLALAMVLALYGLIIALKCIGEVHRFSAWRALGARAIQRLLILGAAIVLGVTAPIVAMFLFR